MQRIRIIYSRGEELLYVGNLDMHKIWERTFRRADLKLAYSQGFHPQPRIHQACPLPLGFTSSNEILDFWLDSDESISQIQQKINEAIQPGMKILQILDVPLDAPPLQTLVKAAKYVVMFTDAIDPIDLQNKITAFLSKNTCMRERRGKQYDLLSLVQSLEFTETPQPTLEMTLVTLPGATGRPEEVLDELSIPLTSVSIDRKQLIFSNDL